MRYIHAHTHRQIVQNSGPAMLCVVMGSNVAMSCGRFFFSKVDQIYRSMIPTCHKIRVVFQSWIGSTTGNARAASEESPPFPHVRCPDLYYLQGRKPHPSTQLFLRWFPGPLKVVNRRRVDAREAACFLSVDGRLKMHESSSGHSA